MTHRVRQRTTVRSYGILVEDERVVLVRSSNPHHDPPLWWLPGGGIDFGEAPEEALIREFAEETGLDVNHPQLVGVTSDERRRDNGERLHTVRILYTVRLTGGSLRDEADGTTDLARWFRLADLGGVNLADYARRALELVQSK
ncbi:MAG: NUDIX domain-containing protein [Actinomycetales bacterium]|nr:NUDIX domain-containing protein [Actinomycetales bacterium]